MKIKQEPPLLFYVNAAIQLAAIITFQHFGIVWPLYIVMVMLSILIVIQTIAAAIVFANVKQTLTNEKQNGGRGGIGFLISIIYMVSCYNIYLIGYIGFAWFALAHVIIQLLGIIFGAMKNDGSSLHSNEK